MTDLSTQRRLAGPRPVRAPRRSTLHCKNWLIEAAYRMIQNLSTWRAARSACARACYS